MRHYRQFLTSVFALVLLSSFTSAFAQTGRVVRYTNATFSGTFSSISNTGTYVGPGDDGDASVTLPFAFNYDSVAYNAGDAVYLGWNGTVGFVEPNCCNYDDPVGDLSNAASSVCGFACDLYSYTTNPEGFYYETQGSAPNRVFVVELANWCTYANTSYLTSTQWKFYEGTNVVEVLFKDHDNYMSAPWDGDGGGTGLNGSSAISTDYIRASGTSQAMTSTPSSDFRFTPPLNQLPTEFSLYPKSLNFGFVAAGTTGVLYDTVQCLGPNGMKFNSIKISGSTAFTLISGPNVGDSVGPNTTSVFGIQFAPTNSGTLTGTFTVSTNARDSATQSAVLNGTGAAAGVTYTFPGVYPYNTLFHAVARRFGDSATESFYVTSSGVAPLTFNSITFTGLQSNMYSLVHVPANPLASGLTDSITVKFKPYVEGRPDAHLIISTNAINIPIDTVDMWGIGKLGHLVITPTSGTAGSGTTTTFLTFDSVAIGDSVCQALMLHNTGTDTLRLQKQIVTYGDYDFTFYKLTGTDVVLAPDATKLVDVCFVPVQQGSRFASIRFYTDIPAEYPSGTDTSQFLVQVTGTGVPFGKLAVSGNASVSALLDSNVCIHDTISNTGASPLTVTNAAISGSSAGDFSVGGVTLPFTLEPGAKQPLQLCFTTANRGAEQDTLTVTGTTSGRTLTELVVLNGKGIQACASAQSPLAFQATLARTAFDTMCVAVTNCGDTAMSFSGAITGDSNFTFVSGTSSIPTVAAGSTGSICVVFHPDTIGTLAATLTLTPSVGAAGVQTVQLTGTGSGVVIVPSGSALTTPVGTTDTFTVTLQNNGNASWTPGTPTVSGGGFATTATVTPATIPAGQSGTLQITYSPTTIGSSTGTLSFAGENPMPLNNAFPYTLSGTAISNAGVAEHTQQDGFVLGASYPNPTNGTAAVAVTMPTDAKVVITLVRLDGSVAATAFDGMLSRGQHTVSLDASKLASGTYIYVLQSGSVRLTRSMIVTH